MTGSVKEQPRPYSCPRCGGPLGYVEGPEKHRDEDYHRCDDCYGKWGLVHIEHVHNERYSDMEEQP